MRLMMTRYSTYEERAVQSITQGLDQMFLFIDPARLHHIGMALAGLAFLVGFVLGGATPVVGGLCGLVGAALGLLAPRVVLRRMVRKRMEKLNEQLPDGLDTLSSSLRAGLTLGQAIERNASRLPPPLAQEFGVISQELRLGTSLDNALQNWSTRNQLIDVKLIVVASSIAMRLGGNLAETYGNLASLIRDRYMFERELDAMTAEGRLQAIVMAAIPFVLFIILLFLNRDPMLAFIASTIGKFMLAMVVAMTVAAYFWIRKIVTIEF
jgi:tight adherence protein B